MVGPFAPGSNTEIINASNDLSYWLNRYSFKVWDMNQLVYESMRKRMSEQEAKAKRQEGLLTIGYLAGGIIAGGVCEIIAVYTTAGTASPSCIALGTGIAALATNIAVKGFNNIDFAEVGLQMAISIVPVGKLRGIFKMSTSEGTYFLKAVGGAVQRKYVTQELEELTVKNIDIFTVYGYKRGHLNRIFWITDQSTSKGVNHAVIKHSFNSPAGPGVSRFNNNIDVANIWDDIISSPTAIHVNPGNGNGFEIVKDFGYNIGIDKLGNQTTKAAVYTGNLDEIITYYPIQ